jgi:predicted DNA-binding protein with PD1-like motif
MSEIEEMTRLTIAQGELGKVFLVRLKRNTDLVTGLIDACRKAGVVTAAVQLIIGSLRHAEISWTRPSTATKRGSERTPPIPISGPVEFISGQAIICLADPLRPVFHVHGVITDQDGKAWAGHFFQGGNPVHSTVDMIVTEIKGAYMQLIHDEEIDLELPVPMQSAE